MRSSCGSGARQPVVNIIVIIIPMVVRDVGEAWQLDLAWCMAAVACRRLNFGRSWNITDMMKVGPSLCQEL